MIHLLKKKLREIERMASSEAFFREKASFPTHAFETIQYEENKNEMHFESIPFVLRSFDEPPSNELELYAQGISINVGISLLKYFIQKYLKENNVVNASTPEIYWKILKQESKEIIENGYTPLLILDNRIRPSWVYDFIEGNPSKNKNPGLLVKKEKKQGKGYISNLSDIQVFFGPSLPPGKSLLLPREALSKVTFKAYRKDIFVNASCDEIEGLLWLEYGFSIKSSIAKPNAIQINYI